MTADAYVVRVNEIQGLHEIIYGVQFHRAVGIGPILRARVCLGIAASGIVYQGHHKAAASQLRCPRASDVRRAVTAGYNDKCRSRCLSRRRIRNKQIGRNRVAVVVYKV